MKLLFKENLQFRYMLEASLLAEAINRQGAFVEIGHILKPSNFLMGIKVEERPLHRIIWECLESMYPSEPITIITVPHRIYKQYGKYFHIELTEILKWDHLNLNVNHYAYLLLEQDLIKNFQGLVETFIQRHTNSDSFSIQKDLMEILPHLSLPNDIFKTINNVEEYLTTKKEFELELGEVRSFKSKIPNRINEIKKLGQVKSLWDNFNSIYNFPTRNKIVLSSLLDLVKYAMITNEIPLKVEEDILKLTDCVFL